MLTEAGTVITVKTSDDSVIHGTLLGNIEEFGCDFILIDIGEELPYKINTGFIIWLREKESGKLLQFPKNKKRKLRAVKS